MFLSKLVCLKLFIPMALSLAIPEVLCLSAWSPPQGLMGLTGEIGKEYSTFIYFLFLGHLNALVLTHHLAK